MKVSKIRAKTAVFKKLIGDMYLYKVFHLVQNSGRKLKGVRGPCLKTLWKWAIKTHFLIFDIYYVALKIVTYVMSYTGYASLVKILLKFELIKAHLSSFRLFSAYLGWLIWAHIGLF